MIFKDENTGFFYTKIRGGRKFLAQFLRKSDGKPTLIEGEKGIFTQLMDVNGNPVSSANPLDIKQTGRNAQEVLFHNALAITDTANKDVNPPSGIDISTISGRKAIMVYSTLNQAVTISILVRNKAGLAIIAGSKNIASQTYAVITSSDVTALADPWQNITLRAACATAPTSGTLTTFLQGVQA